MSDTDKPASFSAPHKVYDELHNDDNLSKYQYFFLSLISLILIEDILYQCGVSNSIIKGAWGINNFSFFPWSIQVILFIILYTFAIPSINNSTRLFVSGIIKSLGGITNRRLKKLVVFTGVSLFITLLFYIFRIKYDFLGELNTRVWQSVTFPAKGTDGDDEKLTMYIMHWLDSIFGKMFDFTPHQTFVFVSVASGFFILFVWAFNIRPFI